MNQILYSKKKESKNKTILIICITAAILLVILSFSFGLITHNSNKIIGGVFINDMNIGALTKDEAYQKINEMLLENRRKSIIIKSGDYQKTITGADLGLTYSEEIIDEAFSKGRTGNLLADNFTVLASYFGKRYVIDSKINISDGIYEQLVNELKLSSVSDIKNDTYTINEKEIIILKGCDGVTVEEEKLADLLLDAFSKEISEVEIPTLIGKAERINVEQLYNDVYVEKVDASYEEGEDFSIQKEVVGISFDKDLAVEKYNEAEDNTQIKVDLIVTEPIVTTASLNSSLFKDVLATFQTKYDKYYTNRATNLEVAGSKINGTILYPGEEFSYNKVVGERTVARGFKKAHVFTGGKVVDGLGGGICQISSTLYNAVLLADLKVTDRTAHGMHTGYVEPSADATVVYGSIDFKFENSRTTPVKLVCTVKNGIATVTVLGIRKDSDPIIEIKSKILKTIPYTTVTTYDDTMDEGTSKVLQSPMNGYVSEAYKVVKDATGKVLSETLISKDSYAQTSKILVVGTKKVIVPIDPDPVIVPDPNIPDNPYYRGD